MTYASVVACASHESARTPPRTSLHSAVVSSTEENDTSGGVIEKIRAAVDAKTSGLQVDRLRKAKDHKVIVACKTKEELSSRAYNTAIPVLRNTGIPDKIHVFCNTGIES